MTDRHSGFLVTLEKPIRKDDAEAIINALLMVKGVIKVEAIVDDHNIALARNQRDMVWSEKLYDLIKNGPV